MQYIILFILTLPVINMKELYSSKMANFMLTNTPILSKYTAKTVKIYDDVYKLVEKKGDKTSKELNEETMDLMLKYDIITPESADKLIKTNKVTVSDEYKIKKG